MPRHRLDPSKLKVTSFEAAAELPVIEALSQTVSACAFGQASAALVSVQAAGRDKVQVEQALADLSAWLSGNRGDPPQWPGYEALAPARTRAGRHGAILLPLQALLAAIESAT